MSDSLATWLYERYGHQNPTSSEHWGDLDPDDVSFWEHEAEAVRRAVTRRSSVGKLLLVPRTEVCRRCQSARGEETVVCSNCGETDTVELEEEPVKLKTRWPELVGKNNIDAVETIKSERPDLTYIHAIPDGSFVTMDLRNDRVRVYWDRETMLVAQEPYVG